MDFNKYFTNDDLNSLITSWAETFPNLISIGKLGESFEKKPIWILTLTNQLTGKAQEKSAVWIDANIHATEISGTTVALFVSQSLLDGYGNNNQITRLLDTSVFYIVPRINPDGAALAMGPNPRYIRSGVRPYPWDEKDDGLHGEDIDNDGRILQMRIPDQNGDWKISSLDNRLMEKRGPDENGGHYYRLFSEGILENYDGHQIKEARSFQGLDFNRNFPFEWRPEAEQTGAGPFPTSEPETRALIEFIVNHPNINLALTYHTFSKVILRPYSTKPDDAMETNDLWVYKRIGARGTEITGYRNVSIFHDFKYHPKEITTGGFDDWMYDALGIFTFTVELWDLPTEAGIKERKLIEWWKEHPHSEDVQILKWVEEHAESGSFVDWYEFKHPQLGKVELGGWNDMFTWRNPPPAYIGQEANRQLPFVLALAEMLPHLQINNLEVTSLTDGKYRLTIVIDNSGFLPTFTSQQGKKRQAIRPVRIELEMPENVSIISGKHRSELGHLTGRSKDLDVTSYGASNPTDNRGKLEWVIQAPAGSQLGIKVQSERAGSIYRTITLP